ncbi:MAG: PKD domain-containing protein [Planctomycetota bacterium]
MTYSFKTTFSTMCLMMAVCALTMCSIQAEDNASAKGSLAVFNSPASATPNPAFAYQTVTFSASVSSTVVTLAAPTVTWNFGDGSSATGNPVTHAYTSSGNYTVTATATDTVGLVGGGATSTFNMIVASQIYDAKGLVTLGRLNVLDFISINATLPYNNVGVLAARNQPSVTTVVVDFNGIHRSFTLDKKNYALVGGDHVSLKNVKSKKPFLSKPGLFDAKINVTLSGKLITDAIKNVKLNANGRPTGATIFIAVNGVTYGTQVEIDYADQYRGKYDSTSK